MSRFRLTDVALADLTDIVRYVQEMYGTSQAIETEDALFVLFEQLAMFPGMGRRRSDLTHRPFLFFTRKPYLIAYEPGDPTMLVHAVFHGARDLPSLFRKRLT